MSSVAGVSSSTQKYPTCDHETESIDSTPSASSPASSAASGASQAGKCENAAAAYKSGGASRKTLAPSDEPMAAGSSELLKKHQARDLNGLLDPVRYKEQNQSSPDTGSQRVNEYHPKSAYLSASAETASALAPDASLHVKVTNAADASDVAIGPKHAEGAQFGVLGADHVSAKGYDGAQTTLGPPSIGVRTGVSHTLIVAKHH